jgi:uncharacterized hydrophobic protein (TIGR00271 family)
MSYIETLRKLFKAKVKIKKEELFDETYAEISNALSFRGANFWLLVCTMVIACIGLNIDSTSAIIGAMLMSPLMNPIVGFAFAMAINDTLLKKTSIKNWFFMTIVSLAASSLFFLISPFDNNTFALQSFTKASLFDILLAFFGGAAGFIGIMKQDGSKVLSGVAVATACMPPLCTAGFGIANGDMGYFLGGLYFYFVNCLFIGLATFITASVNNYSSLSKASTKNVKRTQNIFWVILIIAMLVPGVYLAVKKFNETKAAVYQKSDRERIEQLEAKLHVLDSIIKKNNLLVK